MLRIICYEDQRHDERHNEQRQKESERFVDVHRFDQTVLTDDVALFDPVSDDHSVRPIETVNLLILRFFLLQKILTVQIKSASNVRTSRA